jgi:outer membrane protein
MKKFTLMVVFIGSGLCSGLYGNTGLAQTLQDALVSAYSNNPGLHAVRANLRSTDEGVPQALSNYRPNLAMSADVARSMTHLNTRSPNGDRDQIDTPRNTSLTVTQPLYRGFRTINDVAKAELAVKASRAALLAKEQDVLLSAVTSYMNVLENQAKLDLETKNEQVLKRQLQATQDRFRVGEITRTDVSQAEARVAGAAADRIQSEGNLNNARANYVKVIGEVPGKLSQPSKITQEFKRLEEITRVALNNHPDVVSQRHLELSARKNIKTVEGELLPTVNLVGNLARAWEIAGNDDQKTTGKITLNLTMPLYQKGAVYSKLRAAKQSARESSLKLEEAERNVREASAKAWESLNSAEARIRSFTAQIESAEIALEGVQREAAVGSRTVLDVLDAEQELLDAKISLIGANKEQVVASFQLREAVGQLTAKSLALPVKQYNPMSHYNEVRSKWFGLSSSGQTAK